MLFKELRENLSTKPKVVKTYKAEDKQVIISKMEDGYAVSVEGQRLDENFPNQYDAEEAVNEFLELIGKE
tara:strand:- start:505 stop:714 length:210 start_codon:yes stop_codon:yes gene_type:complete